MHVSMCAGWLADWLAGRLRELEGLACASSWQLSVYC